MTPDSALDREWLVTHGQGGFAAGTVALANTRRYHGLLVASLRPPVDRRVLVSKVDIDAVYRGERFALTTNEYADGTLAPRGHERRVDFRIDGLVPVWTFAFSDALLELRIYTAHGENTSYLRLQLLAATAAVELELSPLTAHRDYHAHQRGGHWPALRAEPDAVTVRMDEGAPAVRIAVDRGRFDERPDWYWNFLHRAERQRGLDATEDLFRPGVFRARLAPAECLHLTATAETGPRLDGATALRRETQRAQRLARAIPMDAPSWVARLQLAADQFIVARNDAEGRVAGRTVIAGYPWFADWGRDTMISLPGLTLPTNRAEDGAAILRTFARHVSEGMLPNRFPDGGEPPEYNTVDATLWFFHALDCHVAATHDLGLLRELLPVMADILAWHERGTRFGIGRDPADGLLRAGAPGVQLTWMDARVGDWVVTPRAGKAVEINALWHFAHVALARWSTMLGDPAAAVRHDATAQRIRMSFRARFWNSPERGLHDVVDVPGGGNDSSLRPNQIFAVSLDASLLAPDQARAVVDVCARHLLTPVGLRSLAPFEPAYVARFEGGPAQRDAAYHQGTVWSWLLGPFALAHLAVYGDADHALGLLAAGAAHLDEACVGQVSEVFDAATPQAPGGCVAQAWGVAETLRAHDCIARHRAANTLTVRKTHHG